ncbi:hypothetical protein, partial [uncultured Parasutterella sp.]|uniref:hypothetical protein n=1 Tax=uncultured Parasutterella sp. TaxID=1263098 RepID=UPI00272CC2CC
VCCANSELCFLEAKPDIRLRRLYLGVVHSRASPNGLWSTPHTARSCAHFTPERLRQNWL